MLVLPRVADKVPHDHEIAGKLHLLDAVDLALQPRLILRNRLLQQCPATRRCATAVSQPLLPAPRGTPARSSCRASRPQAHRNAGNGLSTFVSFRLQRSANCIVRVQTSGASAKSRVHLLRGLDVKLLRVELEALRIVHRVRGLHAQQNLVRAASSWPRCSANRSSQSAGCSGPSPAGTSPRRPSCPAPAHGPESRGRSCPRPNSSSILPGASSWPSS